MPFNGSGVFIHDAANYPAVADTLIEAEKRNNIDDDIATGLSTCITKDGQTTVTADLPMATYKHTNVGNAAARNQYAAAGQVQDGKLNWVDGAGTADAITATYSPAITELVDGQMCCVRATAANATTTPTFAPNGLTARTIVKYGGAALVAGDISGDGHELVLRYDLANTRWELLNPSTPRVDTENTWSATQSVSKTVTETSGTLYAGQLIAANSAASASTANVFGGVVGSVHESGQTLTSMRGVFGRVQSSAGGTGAVTAASAVTGRFDWDGTANVTNASAFDTLITLDAAATITDLWGFRAATVSNGGGATVTRNTVFDTGTQTVGSTIYGYRSRIASAANRWNIYADGTASNYFAGLIDISASTAGQIKFPATQNASSDANTLDDYEEGTWTPGLTFGGASTGITFVNRAGVYRKVGGAVIFRGFIFLSNKGTATGAAVITGAPFASSDSCPLSVRFDTMTYGGMVQAFIDSTNIHLEDVSEAGTRGVITNADFANNTFIDMAGIYVPS